MMDVYQKNFIIICVGQKCSALSRLYVPSSLWESGFKEMLLNETAKIKVGPVTDFQNFLGPVMLVSCPLALALR
jgi:acyl-CoA reductase-like NAD-dependent aldehyde dehydrogenase